MPARTTESCPPQAAIADLASGSLRGPSRAEIEQHLERCEFCRGQFRALTAARFPRFRGYTILSELGRGGFGVVYKAFHHAKERVEALKVLFGKTPLREAYFENEVHLVARLRHSNIATLHEAHLSAPPLYYTMEFVQGQQLDDYFRSRPVSLEERIRILRAVALAVGYAHTEGVVHRDLKPQNILIDSEGQPRIVDFGIARKLGLQKEDGEPADSSSSPPGREGAMGTLGYMAPEQMAGQAADARADIYGLGVLLFHMVTGEPARLATQPDRLARLLHRRQISRSDDLAAIISRAVHPAPQQRYESCGRLVEDLDRYLAGREVLAQERRTPAYRLSRLAALVVRNHLGALQFAAVVISAAALSWITWRGEARFLSPGLGGPQVALVGVLPSTIEAARQRQIGADVPGFDPDEIRSWRLIYGRFMEKLAETGLRAVVWDYYFSNCSPEFDDAFVRGVQRAAVPVVVGAAAFDVNGEPRICPTIRAAVHGCGGLWAVNADRWPNEIEMPLAVQRSIGPPMPSLALTGFAAARFPDSDMVVSVHATKLELRYRRRQIAAGERRWREGETDEIPAVLAEPVVPRQAELNPGDRPAHGRFDLRPVARWGQDVIPLERVLAADSDQLRRWFAGRVVVVGGMLPGVDEHRLMNGETVFGCQVQATALESLLSQTHIKRWSRQALVLWVCLSCAVAVPLARRVPVSARWAGGWLTAGSLGLWALGVVGAGLAAERTTTGWLLAAVIAGCALLCVGALTTPLRLAHQRQVNLAGGPMWPAGQTGNSTTVLATTPRSSGS